MSKLPISVLITTKNEEQNIGRCLEALSAFDEVIVIDSHSEDATAEIARQKGAQLVLYRWDGAYPKKRGWCLDHLDIKHDWVFWVDADEVVSVDLIEELGSFLATKSQHSGFFIRGDYVWHGKVLKYGLKNNKLALFNRHKIEFPVVDDLDIEGMGEIEGHYQPCLKAEHKGAKIGQLKAALLHYAYEDAAGWQARHDRYAQWEAAMTRRGAWPKDPVWRRECLKKILRRSALRPFIMFTYSYIVKLGALDGRAGVDFALSRKKYCDMIRKYLA